MVARRIVLLLAVCAVVNPALAEDWPQWLGPDRASNWDAAGIKASFKDGELQQKWSVPCGLGYSAPSVADGKVYVFDYEITEGTAENNPGRPIGLEGNERLHAIDSATGKTLWTKGMEVNYYVSYPNGPRSAPTIDGDYVYTLGTEGDLVCRRVADGEQVWHVNFLDKFGIKTPIWGHSSSPLVVGNLVVSMVGGEGTAVVAFDKTTGTEAWRAMSSTEPGYSSPSTTVVDGRTCVVAFHPTGVSLLDAETGEEFWTKSIQSKFGMSIAVPRRLDEQMFVTGYGEAMLLDALASGNPKITWKENSAREAVYCSNSTPYFTKDAIFGCDIETSKLMAIDPATGERLWEDLEILVGPDAGRLPRHGTGFIVRHTPSGRYFIFNEQGDLIVCDLTREAITVHGKQNIIAPVGEAFGRDVVWTHPAFAEGCVFARNDREIVCVDLKE